ncbi:hypothetical protein RD110_15770 [Rhodoferax koreense]|uniref:Uncharacterized protein n=1 Tax=Rhodoferax koreensis TaxID=1842727 RepID=A0A1P8JXJ3_9BURK|nr:hypothetical protein [Rhodoferax koreense]APW38479.1 hypothetical protein RD110_15770 [Rhodoferax koreense]
MNAADLYPLWIKQDLTNARMKLASAEQSYRVLTDKSTTYAKSMSAMLDVRRQVVSLLEAVPQSLSCTLPIQMLCEEPVVPAMPAARAVTILRYVRNETAGRNELTPHSNGTFLGWGVDYNQDETGAPIFTAAIVEHPDGKVELLHPNFIQFVVRV